MKKFAFISRHDLTPRQLELAASEDIDLVPVGDRDAFTCSLEEFMDDFDGVIVVHPALAAKAQGQGLALGVFENGNRAPEGEKPSFEALMLHLY